jgi:hypothetical protein
VVVCVGGLRLFLAFFFSFFVSSSSRNSLTLMVPSSMCPFARGDSDVVEAFDGLVTAPTRIESGIANW